MTEGSSLLVLFFLNFRRTRLGQGILWAAVIGGGEVSSSPMLAAGRNTASLLEWGSAAQEPCSGAGHPTAQPSLWTQEQQQLLIYRSSHQKENNQLHLWVLTVFDIQQLVLKFSSIRWNFPRTGPNYWAEIYIQGWVIFFLKLVISFLSGEWTTNMKASRPKKKLCGKNKNSISLLFPSSASLLFLSNC